MSFEDNHGKLITNYESIKKHCLTHMSYRLAKRQMHPELLELEQRKLKLSRMRLKKGKGEDNITLDAKTNGESN